MNDSIYLHRTLRAAALASLAGALSLAAAGCKSKDPAPVITGTDPAAANEAQPYTGGTTGGYANGGTQVLGQSQSSTPQSSAETYETQTPAPIVRHRGTASAPTQYYPVPQANSQASYQSPQGSYDQGTNQGYAESQQQGYAQAPQGGGYGPNYDSSAYNQGYGDAESAGEEALAEADQPPPPLPEYDQPPAPEDDYLWTPGYWNYVNTGYYWVPGAWVAPPFYGALWTPPYWGYERNRYVCHRGYWGSHVGYYGGVNYGFGYIGYGYFGGYWQNRNFYYNRAVTNVNINNVHNVYNRTVVYNNITYGARPDNRTSYNGGRGGLNVQPRPQEMAAMREAHYAPVAAQRDNRLAAANNQAQFFHVNGGRPAQAFAGRPVGNVRSIAATPQGQPFNHSGAAAQPGGFNNMRPGIAGQPAGTAGRPGSFNQPGNNLPNNAARPGIATNPGVNGNRPTTTNQPGGMDNNRPGSFNRPGPGNQPGINNARPAAPDQLGKARTGTFNRPETPSQPVGNSRPGAPSAVGNSRPGTFNRPETTTPVPAVNNPRPTAPNQGENGRPGTSNRPQTSPLPAPVNNHQGQFNRQGNLNQPAYGNNRPAEVGRPNPAPQPPMQPRPNFEAQRPQGQAGGRPSFEAQRPAAAAPAPAAARPQVAAPRPAAPAPAPAPHADTPHGGDHPHGR